jgi:hypothetical protein
MEHSVSRWGPKGMTDTSNFDRIAYSSPCAMGLNVRNLVGMRARVTQDFPIQTTLRAGIWDGYMAVVDVLVGAKSSDDTDDVCKKWEYEVSVSSKYTSYEYTYCHLPQPREPTASIQPQLYPLHGNSRRLWRRKAYTAP